MLAIRYLALIVSGNCGPTCKSGVLSNRLWGILPRRGRGVGQALEPAPSPNRERMTVSSNAAGTVVPDGWRCGGCVRIV